MECLSREFDPIPYDGLVDLLGDSAYSNLFMDTHDRGLLGYILKTCINENAVTTNRYRSDMLKNIFFYFETKSYISPFFKSVTWRIHKIQKIAHICLT